MSIEFEVIVKVLKVSIKHQVWMLCALLGVLTTRAAESELLPPGGMVGPFVGGMASGWVKNCYGANEVVFAEETHDVPDGKPAQRVTCTMFSSGGVQFHSCNIAVVKGKTYTIRLWMKGDVEVPIYIGVRQHGEPYTSYLKRYVRVKNEWRPYVFTGEAGSTDPSCSLFIMFAGTGTLRVGDVALLPGFHEDIAVPQLPLQKGNRIFNSGFEAGSEGWTPTGGFAIDRTMAHSGACSARIGFVESPGAKRRPPALLGIECRPFPVRAGQHYTLSAWIKAAQPATHVQLCFFEWADDGGDQPSNHRNERLADVTVTTDWVRYQVCGIALPNLWEDYVARVVPSGAIWLDDVQIEEGYATDYQPAQAIEVGAETPTRWCRVGERVEVMAHVALTEPIKSYPLTYTFEDLWSRPISVLSRTAEPGVPDRACFTPDKPGMYRVRVRAGTAPATGEVWFGVFPRRNRDLHPDSPFGTHVAAVVPEPTNPFLASEAMGARWVRLHDFGDFCHWHVVEPEQGQFVWRDAEINELRRRGFMILANLGHPPRWAGRPHPKEQDHASWTSAPPRDMMEWENYVFKTVEHFRHRIQHWEIWNEPYWKEFFSGTPEEYAGLLKVAYRAIKRADPQAVVLGGCFSLEAEEWTQRVLAQDALDFMDALTYHVYWSPGMTEPAAPGEPAVMTQDVRHFVELMRAHGKPKPIYMSEGGIRCPPFASWLPKEGFCRGAPFGKHAGSIQPLTGLDAAIGLVRGMVQMLSAGVVNIEYYYTGAVHGKGDAMPWFSTMANGYYVLLDYAGRPKPTMMAYSALAAMLAGAKPAGERQREGLTVHLFIQGGGSVAVLWSDRARPLSVRGTRVFDLMGNEMKKPTLNPGEPVYVCAPELSAEQLRKLVIN